MIRNYFKVAWRNLVRNKAFSITNLLGLTTGITTALLILLWVHDELSFDRSQKNYDQIYQVMAHRDFNNQVFTDVSMVLPLAQSIEKGIPQVKHAVVTTHQENQQLTVGDTRIKKKGFTVSDHFFDVFTVHFVEGNAASAITDPSSIVLSRSTAKALFGNEEAMNKTVKIDDGRSARVSAVIADLPANTTLQFDYIKPFNYADEEVKRAMDEWVSSSWLVYIQTAPGADITLVQQKINDIKKQHDPSDKKISTYFAFPMSKWRLYSDFKDGKNVGGMISYVRMFSIIAVIILLIACVNFMNLATARSEKRAREVGIRKTLGSRKQQLVMQFFAESLILTCVAFMFSLLLVYLLLPAFNTLVDKKLAIDIASPLYWLVGICVIVVTGFVAGSYPALYLSSFKPVKVLKGTFVAGKNAIVPRHVLIVLQFIISIVLISGTIIIYQQVKLIRNRDTGYDLNNLVCIPGTQDTQKNYAVIKQELLQTGMVSAVTKTLSPLTAIWWSSPAPDYEGKTADKNMIFRGLTVDDDFTKALGIKMLMGRDFSGSPADSAYMLLNKAAIEAMGIKNPVGMKMHFGKDYTVIGVTDNIVMESPFKPVDPMMMFYEPQNSAVINLRLQKGVQPVSALSAIEKVFKKYNPAYAFEYQFVDEDFGKKFLNENLMSRLGNIFASLAIFICCIGLAGLAAFTIEKRIREIGIRKVLGASVQQILLLVSKEFLKLVLVAFLLAVPVAWYCMHQWLNGYEFRIQINPWIFGITGLLLAVLTLLVVAANAMGAAIKNPVKSLRRGND